MKLDIDNNLYNCFSSYIKTVRDDESIQIAKTIQTMGLDYDGMNVWNSKSKQMVDLKQRMMREGAIASQELYGGTPLSIGRAWVKSYAKNESAAVHSHPFCQMVGVFYISTDDSCGDICLIDPRGGGILQNDPFTMDFFESSFYTFAPKDGSIIFFPGYMLHFTSGNLSDTVRRCVATNYFFTKETPTYRLKCIDDRTNS